MQDHYASASKRERKQQQNLMIKIKQPRQVITAWTLIGVYAMFWLLWTTHHFFAPEHQHEKKVCQHTPNEKHIHGEEYASDECPVCQFLPAKADLHQFEFALALEQLVYPGIRITETSLCAISPLTISQPRAPPVRLA